MTFTYSASCIGDGHTTCDWHHDGHGFNAAAEKHTKTERHATTTHVAGGPYDEARKR